VITRVGMNNANVGHHRFGEDSSNITRRQDSFKGCDVIEFNYFSSFAWINLRAYVIGARYNVANFIIDDEAQRISIMNSNIENDAPPASGLLSHLP
jgi:hypothetical protein